MPRNGSGVYGLPAGTTAVPNTPIESAKYNAATADIAQALTDSTNVHGTAPWQADQPMGNHKLTGLSAGSAATDSVQLAQVQSGIVAHAASVGGTADAITATFSPAFAAYTAKMRFRFTASGSNNVTAPTINVDGLGHKTIKKLNGQALAAGDIAGSGHVIDCVYDGTDVLILCATPVVDASETAKGIVEIATTAEAQAGTDTARAVTPAGLASVARQKLHANKTIYVRDDGDDGNDGSSDDAGHAFLTIQKALDVVMGLDFNGLAVTIQIGDGTYTGTCVLAHCVGQINSNDLLIQGNIGTPANVVINPTSANAFTAKSGARCRLTGVEFRTTTGGDCIVATDGSVVELDGVRFGSAVGSHIHSLAKSVVYVLANYTISGGASKHYEAENEGAIIVTNSLTITLSGTPAFSGVFANAFMFGFVKCISATFSGSATAIRFGATDGGRIKCGGSSTYFPGNSAGSGTDFHTSPFGWYH